MAGRAHHQPGYGCGRVSCRPATPRSVVNVVAVYCMSFFPSTLSRRSLLGSPNRRRGAYVDLIERRVLELIGRFDAPRVH
jgi:hypothetical protein